MALLLVEKVAPLLADPFPPPFMVMNDCPLKSMALLVVVKLTTVQLPQLPLKSKVSRLTPLPVPLVGIVRVLVIEPEKKTVSPPVGAPLAW